MKINKKSFFYAFLVAFTTFLVGCNQSEDSVSNAEGSGSDGGGEAFYEGEDIEIVVPFGSGGGTDVFARFVSPFLSEHTEGNPDVQVVNVPGGGSITGANEYANMREADGFNAMTTSASTHTPFLLGHSAVQYDLTAMEPIVGFPTGGVVYTTPEVAEDIEDSPEELIYAGISATGLDLVTLLSFEVLGLDVDANLGYEGRGPSRVAFEQGESNIDYQTSSAYNSNVEPLVEQGEAEPLYTFGQIEDGELVRDPAFPDIPTIAEFYEELNGKEPSGVAWDAYLPFVNSSFTVQKVVWLHENAPDKAKEALKEGASGMVEDPEFSEEGDEILGGYEPYSGEKLEDTVSAALNVDEDVIDWVERFLDENYDVTVE